MMERVTHLDQRAVTVAEEPNVLWMLAVHAGCAHVIPPMKKHGVGIVNRLVSRGGGTQTVVGVIEHNNQPLVKSVQPVEDVGSREHARGRDRRDVTAGQQATILPRVPARDRVPEWRTSKRMVCEPVPSDDQPRVMHHLLLTQEQSPTTPTSVRCPYPSICSSQPRSMASISGLRIR